MTPRPRQRIRANWPTNLHEPRPGYYTWRDPRDGRTHVIGRVSLAEAILESHEANVIAANGVIRRTLLERVTHGKETISDLLDKFPTDGMKPNTAGAMLSQDKIIREKLGAIQCQALTIRDVSELIEGIKKREKLRWAQAIRTRLIRVCKRGCALGWMEKNVAALTEEFEVEVKRKRLSLEQFKEILEVADQVEAWLPNAMLLALVSGQDRSTIAAWQRSSVQGDVAVVRRSKTEVKIAIPLALRLDAIGMSLGDVIAKCKSTGVVSKNLIHHIRHNRQAPRGSAVVLERITTAFREARVLAKIDGDHPPTFHEIRSLTKRLYEEQGDVDTKALLGHMSDTAADLYANPRGLAPIKVKLGGTKR